MSIPEEQQQSLIEHLSELRFRLVRSLWFIVAGFLISWYFSEQIVDFIRAPIEPYLKATNGGLVFNAPTEKLMAHIKVSALAGFILSSPFWFYQLWMFIAPGLYQKERKYAFGFVFFGTGLFLVGVSFAYFIVFDLAFKYLLEFGGTTDVAMITLNEHISFFITTMLVFGTAFEMPLIIAILGLVGIVDAKFLSEKRRYAIVALAAISAVVTPPDALSMCLMLIPLVALYELSIVIVRILAPAQTK